MNTWEDQMIDKYPAPVASATEAPVRTTTPVVAPMPGPLRRLDPNEVCGNQKVRIVRELTRVL